MSNSRKKIQILCAGNPYRGDDAFGPLVARHLFQEDLPDFVGLYDIGTQGLSAMHRIDRTDEIILVDVLAPSHGDLPGRIRFFPASQLRRILNPGLEGSEEDPEFEKNQDRKDRDEKDRVFPGALAAGAGLHNAGLLELIEHIPILFEGETEPVIRILAATATRTGPPVGEKPSPETVEAARRAAGILLAYLSNR